MKATQKLAEAIAVTAELTGTVMSEPAARVMANDLARYPEAHVLQALTRCRRELKGRLTIADVLTRIDDGRPGPEEAWSMMPMDEGASIVWTEEMAQAFGTAYPLIREGETITARMAFLERYRVLVRQARDEGRPAKWTPSLGTNVGGRERVLLEAANLGRLTRAHVSGLLPYRGEPSPEVAGYLPDLTQPVSKRTLKDALTLVRSRKNEAA